jgi:hypothetical protein
MHQNGPMAFETDPSGAFLHYIPHPAAVRTRPLPT